MQKSKRIIILISVIIILVFLIAIMASIQISKNKEQTSLITKDGYTLSYEFHQVSDKGIILLHMMNRNKEDYKDLANLLNKKGYSTIAVDLRGHGKSAGSWQNFKDEDFKNIINDIDAAKNFLNSKGINQISIIGASISANLALNYAANNVNIKKLILLSPGENYHNIKVLDVIQNYKNPLLLVAAKDDTYSYQTAEKLEHYHAGEHKFISYDTGGHGTFIFLEHPELNQIIIEFLDEN